MSSPLSNELFFNVHRGVLLRHQDVLDKESLGIHWSASHEKANEFATKHLNWPEQRGVVMHGQIPMSSVETNPETLQKRGFADFIYKGRRDPLGEKEVPMQTDKPVMVTGMTTYRRKERYNEEGIRTGSEMRQRTRKFNPPRQMKA